MRTTVELPDELMKRARNRAAATGTSLKEFLIEALEEKLAPRPRKTRRPPPSIGSRRAPQIGLLTPEQIDEAMFG